MHDLSTIVRRNKEAVLGAFAEAVRDGDTTRATVIQNANPDIFGARGARQDESEGGPR